MKHGKKYVESAALVDRLKQYDPMESMELVCKTDGLHGGEADALLLAQGRQGLHDLLAPVHADDVGIVETAEFHLISPPE